jgi:hypothetical protein
MISTIQKEKSSIVELNGVCFSCYFDSLFQSNKAFHDEKTITRQFLEKLTPGTVNVVNCPCCKKKSSYIPLEQGKWAEELS